MARDWSKAFRRASFRGVRFWVESDGPSKGRRAVVHEISGGELPVTEDMGRCGRSFYVLAYLAGENAPAEAMLMEMACEQAGPSLLILPMDAGQLAHCIDCTRNRERDRNGYIAYDLEFVEASFGGLSVSMPIGRVGIAFSAGAGGFAASIQGVF